MFRIICLLIGYFIGCIQVAYIVGKLTAKIDIREHGSGNAGSTNITRVLGAKAGMIVFVADVLKGISGFLICTLLFDGDSSFFSGNSEMSIVAGLYGGLGVVLGHNFPFQLKFKGGKGVASGLGVILCTNLLMAFSIYCFGTVAVAATKYISMASLVMAFIFPIFMYFYNFPIEAVAVGAVLMFLSFYQHRTNIVRIANGTENKFNPKKKGMMK